MFDLDKEQGEKAEKWLEEQRTIALKKQGLGPDDIPNFGSIGGAVTYSFTPTSLGVIVKIKHYGTGNEIDLTPYTEW